MHPKPAPHGGRAGTHLPVLPGWPVGRHPLLPTGAQNPITASPAEGFGGCRLHKAGPSGLQEGHSFRRRGAEPGIWG